MNPWLQLHGPGLIHQWCHQQAEPILSTYLEQWMLMNATALISQITTKQLQQQQLQIQLLQANVQQLTGQIQQLQTNLNATHPAKQPSPHSPTTSSSPIGSTPPGHTSLNNLSTYSPPGSSHSLGFGRRIANPLASRSTGQSSLLSTGPGIDELTNPTTMNQFPDILDIRTLMRNRLTSAAAANANAAFGSSNTPPATLSPTMSTPTNTFGSTIGHSTSGSTFHRPLGLGLGLGRSSPDSVTSPQVQLRGGPVADLLISCDTLVGPGEEATRDSTTTQPSSPGTRDSPTPRPRRMSIGSAPPGPYEKSSMNLTGGILGLSTPPSQPPTEILIVEDVRVAQKLAHVALTRAHFKVDIAASGEVAIDKFRALLPIGSLKVILMDISLPGMSGIETTERIRRIEQEWNMHTGGFNRNVWIYGLTGSVDPDDLVRYRSAGMNGCILKGRLLVDSVRTAMEESERNPSGFVNLAEKSVSRSMSPSITHPLHSVTPPPLPASPTIALQLPTHVALRGSTNISPLPLDSGSGSGSGMTSSPMIISSAPSSPLPPPASPNSNVQMGSTTHPLTPTQPQSQSLPSFPQSIRISSPQSVNSPTPDFSLLRVGGSLTSTPVGARSMTGPNMDPSAMLSISYHPSTSSSMTESTMSLVGAVSGSSSNSSSGRASPLPSPTPSTSSSHSLNLVPKRLLGMGLTNSPTSSTGGIKRSLATMESGGSLPPSPSISSPSSASSHPRTLSQSPTHTAGFDVLLVEDVRVAQRIAQRALQSSGYRVDVASSGEAAIERFKLHADTLRIILMDINLPGMSGTDATEAIRAYEQELISSGHHRTPVLVFGLTGNTDEANLKLYESAGMNGCIAKGTLLGQAVHAAVESQQRAPGAFVHLSGMGTANLTNRTYSPTATVDTTTHQLTPIPMQLPTTQLPPSALSSDSNVDSAPITSFPPDTRTSKRPRIHHTSQLESTTNTTSTSSTVVDTSADMVDTPPVPASTPDQPPPHPMSEDP